MTPITNDDSAPQLMVARVRSNKPVGKVADAILEKISIAGESRQADCTLSLSDRQLLINL